MIFAFVAFLFLGNEIINFAEPLIVVSDEIKKTIKIMILNSFVIRSPKKQ